MSLNKERRRVIWAVLASILVHMVVAVSLAAFNQVLAPVLPVEEELPEITFVDLPEPPPVVAAASKAPFIDVDESKQVEKAPEDAIFESSANTEAATEAQPSGQLPLPSQEGRESEIIQTENQNFALDTQGARQIREQTPPPVPTQTPKPTTAPTPSVAPSVRPSPTPQPTIKDVTSPTPTASPEAEQLAMLTATPPPPLRHPDEAEPSLTPPEMPPPAEPVPSIRPRPESPTSAYQPLKDQTRVTGNITKRGASSVGAAQTPLGVYQQKIFDAIGSRWYANMVKRGELANIGTARLEAQVDENGRVQNLKVVSNNSNEAFANICLQSFQEARIPPFPPDLVPTLPEGGLTVEVSFTQYTNR